MEFDDALKVVVLESGNPNFFINHYDVSRAAETPVAPGPTGLPTWIDTTTRLAAVSVVTNYAAGLSGGDPSHEETQAVAHEAADRFKRLLRGFIRARRPPPA